MYLESITSRINSIIAGAYTRFQQRVLPQLWDLCLFAARANAWLGR